MKRRGLPRDPCKDSSAASRGALCLAIHARDCMTAIVFELQLHILCFAHRLPLGLGLMDVAQIVSACINEPLAGRPLAKGIVSAGFDFSKYLSDVRHVTHHQGFVLAVPIARHAVHFTPVVPGDEPEDPK